MMMIFQWHYYWPYWYDDIADRYCCIVDIGVMTLCVCVIILFPDVVMMANVIQASTYHYSTIIPDPKPLLMLEY